MNDIEKALGITVDALLNEDEREKIRNVSKTSEASFVDKLIEPHKAQRDSLEVREFNQELNTWAEKEILVIATMRSRRSDRI
ncbi:hypothetical protein PY93_10035 [Lacticaseibacillus rhamnosus]|uniref:hypothetical protein n=1 Tax=Lacticaseibacillus rhamnosus TaxID=47715 RepID=UPI0007DF150B|nr:hypothetical protein [Lacticaseibacillus rhamnosus]OAU48722.1 hypothetical protein PY93_10035 [Lacticaseibacillus rhamnosus]